jgi:hypothetical protein
MQHHDLTLGQRVFLEALQDVVKQREDLVRAARVSYKQNAAGDLVFAVNRARRPTAASLERRGAAPLAAHNRIERREGG